MEKTWVGKSNSHMDSGSISVAIWVVCAVRMAVLQYGYGTEYRVAGLKKGMINGCDHGFCCENPEQNLWLLENNRNPTTASFEPKNHNLLHHNPTTASFTHKNRNRNQAPQPQLVG